MADRIAVVLTSHTQLGASGRLTGFWFEELAAPYYVFADAGYTVELFAAGERTPAPDPLSLTIEGGRGLVVDRFLEDSVAKEKLERARRVSDLEKGEFDAIFLAGGHGVMWDFPGNSGLADAVGDAFSRGAVVAALCHGPAGLVNLRDAGGAPIVSGRRITGFTNSEEQVVGLTDVVPFLLESRLREHGARFENGAPFTAHVVRDGALITGQNPQSSVATAQAVLDFLGAGSE
jgi:putative intracellular protease/amidase